ncbi:MAG: prepilin-type N-terminal cleavage/methylation domain-containing protein [Pseudobacteriovorax sp.]|nr:prepilin-type N-terminal cleavage/methylation domain-containing protein [Pseudobacteriovorax sp.]
MKSNSGLTLIELFCAVAVLSIVTVAAMKLSSRFLSSKTHDLARKNDSLEIRQLAKTIERDLKFAQNISILNNGLGIQIRRIGVGNSPNYGSYDVSYISRCNAIPPELASSLGDVYQAGNRARIYAPRYTCLNRLRCPINQFPGVEIVLAGAPAVIADYPNRQFPNFNTG